ncbi:MAG: flagellar biosynthesis anti-sigma factor FlgM [Deltaproteobacteria bacterium]|jgi:negative regulator of flagellin synthesis FlgM|nr:flagellar biosynthesis anti-sigma factor FlgM [Deltaproteobacteria bacterium]
MKIDANNNPQLKIKKPEIQPSDKGSGKESVTSSATTVASGDKVNLSDRSRLIAKASELANLAPDIRSEKVAELTARIAANNYNVSSETIADSILKNTFKGLF